jgi:hypothetical protein
MVRVIAEDCPVLISVLPALRICNVMAWRLPGDYMTTHFAGEVCYVDKSNNL